MSGPSRRRVLLLGAVELLLAIGGLVVVAGQPLASASPSPATFVGYLLLVTVLVLLPRMYVEFRRHAVWLTPADWALLVGLFALGPYAVVAAGMVAEVAAALKHRQSPLKTGFNLVHMLGGLVAAATTFAVIGPTDPLEPLAWLAGGAAVAACAGWDLVSTAAVMAIAERQSFGTMIVRLLPAAAIGLVVSALLGVAALVLFAETPAGPLLFAPVLAILVVSTRSVARQRAERLHFERLYAASSNLAELVGLQDMLGRVATEARGMVTGSSAICCTVGPEGTPIGVLVDDDGTRDASPTMLAALETAIAGSAHGQLDDSDVDRDAYARLPAFRSMAWAVKRTDEQTALLLVVFRELPSEADEHQAEILTAFVAHAAAIVANVGLHAEVQGALHRQVELNRQKSEFVAAVSHELRTPLAAMLGSIQTVQRLEGRMSDDDRSRMLEMGISQGGRLQGLIEDLLLVAAADHREVEANTEALPVARLLASVGSELDALVGDRLTVEVDAATGDAVGDEDRLRRIVLNLVDNARKYAPEGPITLTAHREADRVVVAVTDHGPGIPEPDRERIFERFVQLDQSSTRRQGGTGLGLFLCRELAAWLEGSLELASPAAGGSRFELRLPAAPTGSRTPEPRSGTRGIAMERPAGLIRRPPGAPSIPSPGRAPAPPATGIGALAGTSAAAMEGSRT